MRFNVRTRYILGIAITAMAVFFVPLWCQFAVEFCVPRPFFTCIRYFLNRPVMALIGYFCLWFPFLFLTLATGRAWIPSALYSVVGIAAALGNYYKKAFRGDPLLPLDVFYTKDALAMTQDLHITITKEMIIMMVVFVVMLVACCFVKLPYTKSKRSRILRAATSVVALIGTVVMYNTTVLSYTTMENLGYSEMSQHVDTYYQNSFYTSFFTMAGTQLFSEPPEGYGNAAIGQIADELQQQQQSGQNKPDVIEILFESFEGMEPYHSVLEFEDVIPHYRTIALEGVSGQMVTLGYGGGTGDVEFEVLTGLDSGDELVKMVAFAETYSGYPSIGNYLSENGYGVFSMHAYTSQLYHRLTGYENLGVDEQYYIDSFENPEMVGEFVSDASFVQEIIDLYEEKIQSHDHVYIHGVSMQNHTPHNTYKMAESEQVEVTGGQLSETDRNTVRNFATLTQMTDEAIAQLIEYFRTVDRDVLIVLYGDHRGLLLGEQGDILSRLGYMERSDAQLQLHQAPYLVWSNFETKEAETFGTLSPGLLLPYALGSYDVISPAYFTWLVEESKTGPLRARSGDYVVYTDGTVGHFTSEDLQALQRRHIFQYNATKKNGRLGEMEVWAGAA